MNISTSTVPASPSNSPQSAKSKTGSNSRDKFQFLREEGFAWDKAKKSSWNMQNVIAEAIRKPGNCPHVEQPPVPICHFGLPPEELMDFAEELREKSKSVTFQTLRGARKQRKDTPILIGIVASIPIPPSERNSSIAQEWIAATLRWLRERFGDVHLASVIEHTDEGYIHLHAFVHNDGASVKPLMAGHSAASAAKASGKKGKEITEAFKRGLREMLDSYNEVCRPLGMLRCSPAPRRRVPRAQYLQQKERDLLQKESELTDKENELRGKDSALSAFQKELNSLWTRLINWESELQVTADFLAQKWRRLSDGLKRLRSSAQQRNAKLDAREESLDAKASSLEIKEKKIEESNQGLARRWTDFHETFRELAKSLNAIQKSEFANVIKRLRDRPR